MWDCYKRGHQVVCGLWSVVTCLCSEEWWPSACYNREERPGSYERVNIKVRNSLEYFWRKRHFSRTFPATVKIKHAQFKITRLDAIKHGEECLLMTLLWWFQPKHLITIIISRILPKGKMYKIIRVNYKEKELRWNVERKARQSIWTVWDISRDDRARIATCSLGTATDRFKENYSI